MKAIPFQIQHFDLLELRPQELRRLALDPASRLKVEALARHNTGGTVIHDGRIIGVMGWFEMWPGVIELWAFPSVYAARYPLTWVRTAKRYIQLVQETHQPHRMQSTSLNDELHIRWMQALGFTLETDKPIKKYYVDGSDALMWGIVL